MAYSLHVITQQSDSISFIDLLLDDCKHIIKDVTLNLVDSCIKVETDSLVANTIFNERAKQLNVSITHTHGNHFLIAV